MHSHTQRLSYQNRINIRWGALSRLPGRSISGTPPPRKIYPFWNRYQRNTHYIVPLNSAILSCKILKHRKYKLERHVNNISDSDWPSLAETSRDKSRWQTLTCVWDHVCHLCCSMLISRENKPVQMQIMSEYIFIYETLLNFLRQPPKWYLVWQADGSTTPKTPYNNPPVTSNYQNFPIQKGPREYS